MMIQWPLERLIEHGMALAHADNAEHPDAQDAIWALLCEAADTLKRLPPVYGPKGPKIWMDILLDPQTDYPPDPIPRRGVATSEAISRMEIISTWMRFLAGRQRRRNARILWSWASDVPLLKIRERTGLGREALYKVRRLCLQQIAMGVITNS